MVFAVPWGEVFRERMASCRPRQQETPAASLLPERYDIESVAAILNDKLRRLAGLAVVGYEEQP